MRTFCHLSVAVCDSADEMLQSVFVLATDVVDVQSALRAELLGVVIMCMQHKTVLHL